MKVLSVRNPWSHLILRGGKDVENRTWTTNYRGRLYIHSSGDEEWDFPDEVLEFVLSPEFKKRPAYIERLRRLDQSVLGHYQKLAQANGFDISNSDEDFALFTQLIEKSAEKYSFFLNRAIVGYVDLVDVVKDSPSPWAQRGAYHWVLEKPVVLDTPVLQVKGRLGLWSYELPK